MTVSAASFRHGTKVNSLYFDFSVERLVTMEERLAKAKSSIESYPAYMKCMIEPVDIRMENSFDPFYRNISCYTSLEIVKKVPNCPSHLLDSSIGNSDLGVSGHLRQPKIVG